jgi:Raf kinase inhibitor-like YbhB/YbcL family protein
MTGRRVGEFCLAMGLLAVGCSPTPELQGAEIATPPASSPVAQPIDIPPTTAPPTPVEAADLPQAANTAQGTFTLESAAFSPGDVIPVRFSCDGEDISPELKWGASPSGTVSLALIMDDPDAPGGTWIHWVIFNMPPDRTGLPEGVPAEAELADGSRQGTNSGRRLGYAGPCPPGETHRYFFKLYALDQGPDLASGATADELTAVMDGHIIGQAELMGTYTRD